MINAPLSTATFPHRLLTILEKALGTRAIYSDFQEEKNSKKRYKHGSSKWWDPNGSLIRLNSVLDTFCKHFFLRRA